MPKLSKFRILIFKTHKQAHCRHTSCRAVLRGTPRWSGHAPPNGAWVQRCERCGHRTHYDLTDPKQRFPKEVAARHEARLRRFL